jgi:3-deoxy-D-manno-octulosonate 8-phosphate phosphatase, YrbI family
MKISRSLVARARKIKLIAMDVDGVLTAGQIIVFDSGEELKIWNVKDGMGIYLAKRAGAGIKFAWITGRSSKQVVDRAKEMGIDTLYQGCMKKKDAFEKILGELGFTPEEALFLGDDLVDVPVFREAGIAICPKDAPDEVKRKPIMFPVLTAVRRPA